MIVKTLEEYFLNQLKEKDEQISLLKEKLLAFSPKEVTGIKVTYPPGYYEVGKDGVLKISYHQSLYHESFGAGDRHFCDIEYENGSVIRVFDLERIYGEGESRT